MSQAPIPQQVKLIIEDRLDLEYFHDQLKKAAKVPISEFKKL